MAGANNRGAERRRGRGWYGLLAGAWLLAGAASAQEAGSARQSRDDAWWTGPMLANSADTLPPGHLLVEPYVYDVTSRHRDGFGSRAYVLVGVTDRLTLGVIPIIGYTRVGGGANSSGIGGGDPILQAQYRLTRFHEGSALPTLALMLQESVPTARYDRLGTRPADGMGGGAYATTLGLNAQTYLWTPGGRIVRLRLNLTRTFPGSATVDGVSVYGTGEGFHGRVHPGRSSYVDTSVEYSLTRRWVLALDVFYNHGDSTRVGGYQSAVAAALPLPVQLRSGSSDAFGYAPAVEYSWTPNIGVLLGVRVITGGHGTPRSVTPAIAINYVR